MKRTVLLTVALSTALAGCGGSSSGGTQSVGGSPSASATTATGSGDAGSCTPSGKGTTDLKVKPVAAYLKDAEPTETTIHDIVCGTGAEAKEGSAVEVKYVGVLFKDGKEFDSSWSRGASETLPFTIGGGVIPGFSKGTLGMKIGGRREVVIPSKDGYGDQGSGPIPGGATLVFIIDLVKTS